MSAGSGSKLWRCFPCIPAKQPPAPDPNVAQVTTQDDQDVSFWQDGSRTYSKRQICRGVAIVLSGYDAKAAAGAIDPSCDPNTVNIWVQLYKPPFFEDGMLCPPALIMWWMNEKDRKDKEAQGQALQQQQPQAQSQAYVGPIQNAPTAYNGPVGQSGGGALQNPSVFGTSYLKVPFMTPDGTVVTQTVTTPGTANPNSIVISSPSVSQPNVRVYYQDPSPGPYMPPGQSGGPATFSSLQQQRPNSVPQAVQPMTYDSLGRPFQAQLTRVKEAEDALNALQAQVQNQSAQGSVQGAGPARPGRGPPYQLLN